MRPLNPSGWLFTLVIAWRMAPTYVRRVLRKIRGRTHEFDASVPRRVPRRLWLYWDKGEAAAPALVQDCIASWREKNPGWDIKVLDAATAGEMAGIGHDPESIPIQSYADLLRLRLLRRHGGVWADATTYCLKPLDDWLPLLAQRGFFAFIWRPDEFWFLWPGMRRRVTNWFLASEPEGLIVSMWEEACFAYWEGRKRPQNYFWPHLMIDYLCLTSRRFRRALGEVPVLGCFAPHLIHDVIEHRTNHREVADLVGSGAIPVQKLQWRLNEEDADLVRHLLAGKVPPGKGDAAD